MQVERVLKHIEKVRHLEGPAKPPRPGRKIRLSDESYNIFCCVSEDLPDEHKFKKKYYIRRKKTVLCMCLTWESLCDHMGWSHHEGKK
jgi:hypothetical protein